MLDPYTLQKGSATKQNSLLILGVSSSKHLMLEYDLKLKKKKKTLSIVTRRLQGARDRENHLLPQHDRLLGDLL